MARVTLLQKIGPLLIDMIAQHANQDFTHVDTHRDILDTFANLSDLKKQVQDEFLKEKVLSKELSILIEKKKESLLKKDILIKQLKEPENAGLKKNEEETLFSEFTKL